MSNETSTTNSWTKAEESSILTKIKWFFKKKEDDWWERKNQRMTRAFNLTRKDSLVSVLVALIVICIAVFYWKKVLDEYSAINDRADELKYVSAYNVIPKWDILSPYAEGNTMNKISINWMIWINNKIEKERDENENFKQQQKSYYEVLLQNIYLPSLNVWKDPYTKDFDMSILWQKYLEKDKYQDLYLIQYWSDFAKYVWNDADYNTINTITIWEKTVLPDNPNYFYTPITITFTSPNKRSFLLLVNKLSMTSNTNNIALLNEFFHHLLESIKAKKAEEIRELEEEYRDMFIKSDSWEFTGNLSDLTWDDLSKYVDRVIWYNLYHRINQDWKGKNVTPLIDEDVIIDAIAWSALCPKWKIDENCFYDFREKYRNLPYLAYKVGLNNQTDRTSWLLSFLQDLPPVIAITTFRFDKFSESSFLNNKEEEYQWEVIFNAFWKNVSDADIEEASVMLWKLCFWTATDQKITPDLALQRVTETISSKWWYQNVSSLWELQLIFTEAKESYKELSNYDKIIKLFEIRRMMNDSNLCNK